MHKIKDMVSIIVPVYNAENYLEKCICSVLEQSYTNFELILVDDGSTDNSLNICRVYEKKDSRIKALSKSNEGVSVARNCGIEICKGKFVVFLDADDWIERDYVKNIMFYVSEESDLWVMDYSIDRNGQTTKRNSFTKEFDFFNKKDIIALEKQCLIPQYRFSQNLKSEFFLAGVWGKVFKTTIIKERNIRFAKELKISEDVMFLTEYLENCYRVKYFHEYGYHYVARQTSKMHDFKKSLFDDYVVYIDKLKLDINQKKLENIDVKIAYAIAIRTLYTFFSNGFFLKINEGNEEVAAEYIKQTIEQRLNQYICIRYIPYLELRHKVMLFCVRHNQIEKFLMIMKIKTGFRKQEDIEK